MTIAVSQITNNQTFGTWLAVTNRIANLMSQNVVTADSSNGGSVTIGNTYIDGHFGATYVYVSNTLSGGNVSSGGVLTLLANVAIANGTSNVLTVTANSTILDLTVSTNSTSLLATGNTTISGNTLVVNTANVIFNNSNVQFTNSPLSGNITLTSNVTFNNAVIVANGSFGPNSTALYSNGTGMYWQSVPNLVANTGIVANADGIFVNSAYYVTTSANNTDAQTYYFPMTNAVSGVWSNGIVSDSKLYFVPSTGDLNATNFNSLSDKSIKKNVEQIVSALDVVLKLEPVTFEWVDSGKKSSGFIAQDLETILPDLIHEGSNKLKSVNYDGIIPYLVKAICEQQEQINQLKKIIEIAE